MTLSSLQTLAFSDDYCLRWTLTLIKLAQAMEMAKVDVQQLQNCNVTPETEVGTVNKTDVHPRGRMRNQNCYRCGRKHKASKCRHRETVCHNFGIKGHINRACHRGRRNQPRVQQLPTLWEKRRKETPT